IRSATATKWSRATDIKARRQLGGHTGGHIGHGGTIRELAIDQATIVFVQGLVVVGADLGSQQESGRLRFLRLRGDVCDPNQVLVDSSWRWRHGIYVAVGGVFKPRPANDMPFDDQMQVLALRARQRLKRESNGNQMRACLGGHMNTKAPSARSKRPQQPAWPLLVPALDLGQAWYAE